MAVTAMYNASVGFGWVYTFASRLTGPISFLLENPKFPYKLGRDVDWVVYVDCGFENKIFLRDELE